jgi:hypothetical protein
MGLIWVYGTKEGYKKGVKHDTKFGSMDLRNVGNLPHHYTASKPRRTRLESLSRSHSLHTEDGGSKVLRIFGLLLYHYRVSQPRRSRLQSLSKPHSLHPEDGGSMVL